MIFIIFPSDRQTSMPEGQQKQKGTASRPRRSLPVADNQCSQNWYHFSITSVTPTRVYTPLHNYFGYTKTTPKI